MEGSEKNPKQKPRGVQPKTHAGKTRAAVQARRYKIIMALIEGKTGKQAGIEAGLSPRTAESQVSMILKEPEVQQMLCRIYERKGLTYEYAVDRHKELMEANNAVPCISGKKADEKTVDFVDVPNWAARAKALDLYYKTRGVYQEKNDLPPKSGPVFMLGFGINLDH